MKEFLEQVRVMVNGERYRLRTITDAPRQFRTPGEIYPPHAPHLTALFVPPDEDEERGLIVESWLVSCEEVI